MITVLCSQPTVVVYLIQPMGRFQQVDQLKAQLRPIAVATVITLLEIHRGLANLIGSGLEMHPLVNVSSAQQLFKNIVSHYILMDNVLQFIRLYVC